MENPSTFELIHWTHEGITKEVNVVLGETAEIESVKIIDENGKPEGNGVPEGALKKLHLQKRPQQSQQANGGGCGTCGSKGIKRLLLGGAKLLKAELGMDACSNATITDRRNLCESCEHYDFGVCDQCGCFCAAKVKLKSEKCPKGLW